MKLLFQPPFYVLFPALLHKVESALYARHIVAQEGLDRHFDSYLFQDFGVDVLVYFSRLLSKGCVHLLELWDFGR